MSSYKKLLSNTLLITLGQFSSKLLGFLLVPLYTSLLTAAEYGAYDLIVTTVSLLSPVLTMVATDAVMRFCLEKDYENSHVLTIGLCLVGMGTLLLLAAYPIFQLVDILANDYWWLVCFFVLANLESVLLQYLKGTEKIKIYSVCSVFSTASNLALNILFLVVFKWGILGYMLAICCSRILVVSFITISQRLWKLITNPFKIDKNVYVTICKFSIPMIPNSVSWWVSNSSDKYMIRIFVSVAAVGVYSVAYKIPSILSIIATIFISAFQISSVENFGSKQSRDFFSNVYKAYSACNNIIAAVFVAFAMIIAKVMFQNEFYDAWQVSCVLVMAYVFNSLSSYLGTIYTASRKTTFLFYSTLTAALMNIVLNVVLIKRIGIQGASIATLISYMCVWLMRLVHSRKILPMSIEIGWDILSYLLLGVEIVFMITRGVIINIPAMIIMVIIVGINLVVMLQTDIFAKLLARFRK